MTSYNKGPVEKKIIEIHSSWTNGHNLNDVCMLNEWMQENIFLQMEPKENISFSMARFQWPTMKDNIGGPPGVDPQLCT